MRWDGSFLGTFKKDELVVAEDRVAGRLYWQLIGGDYCVAFSSRKVLPCVVDEIKPFFGIIKTGTCRVVVGRRHFVLYRVMSGPVPLEKSEDEPKDSTCARGLGCSSALDVGDPWPTEQTLDFEASQTVAYWEPSLNLLPRTHELRQDPGFREAVKRIFTYRDLFGLTGNFERNVWVRTGGIRCDGKIECWPVSVREFNRSLADKRLSTRIQNLWFSGEQPGSIVSRLLLGEPDRLPFQSESDDNRPINAYIKMLRARDIAEKMDRDSIIDFQVLLERVQQWLC